MTSVFFVSCDYIKEVTAIENAVDDALITPFITITQDTVLQEILGTTYFDELQTQVAAGSLTAVNEALIRNYIQPVVAHFTFWNIIPHLQYHSSNKSIITRTSDTSTTAELNELQYFRNGIRDTAEYYKKRLVRELTVNLTKYPTYATSTGLDNVPKRRRTYFNGIYISRPYDSDCNLGLDYPTK